MRRTAGDCNARFISRFLIVDDNEGYLRAARDLLRREGLDVVGIASTGQEAMRVAADAHPDVALVDVDLGPESGFDVATRLVAERSMQVVLISAYSEAEFGELAEASVAVGFISKTELSAARIAEVLDRGDDHRSA